MKALKVLTFVLLATFCYTAVSAQTMHHRRHHHRMMKKHHHMRKM